MTTRSADKRAWEIYAGATGVPGPFKVEYSFPVSRCALAERTVHEELRKYQWFESREFYLVSQKIARRCIATVGTKINEQFGEPTPPKIEAKDWVILAEDADKEAPESPQLDDKPVIVARTYSRKRAPRQDTIDAELPYPQCFTPSQTAQPTPAPIVKDTQPKADEPKPSGTARFIPSNSAPTDLDAPAEKETYQYTPPINWFVVIFVLGIGGIGNLGMGLSFLSKAGEASQMFGAAFFAVMGAILIIVGLKNIRD